MRRSFVSEPRCERHMLELEASGAHRRPDAHRGEVGWGLLDLGTCAVEHGDVLGTARALLTAARTGLTERGVSREDLQGWRLRSRLETQVALGAPSADDETFLMPHGEVPVPVHVGVEERHQRPHTRARSAAGVGFMSAPVSGRGTRRTVEHG